MCHRSVVELSMMQSNIQYNKFLEKNKKRSLSNVPVEKVDLEDIEFEIV